MTKETPITLEHVAEDIARDSGWLLPNGYWDVDSAQLKAAILEALTTHTQELTSQITLLREELREAKETGLKDYEGMREFQAKFIEADKKGRLVDHWKQAFDTEWSINQDLNAQIQAIKPVVKAAVEHTTKVSPETWINLKEYTKAFLKTPQANELIGE